MTFIRSVYASCNLLPTDSVGLTLCSWKHVCVYMRGVVYTERISAFLPTVCAHFLSYQASAFSRTMYTWADLVSERKLSHDRLLLSYRGRNAAESDYRDAIVFIAVITSSQPSLSKFVSGYCPFRVSVKIPGRMWCPRTTIDSGSLHLTIIPRRSRIVIPPDAIVLLSEARNLCNSILCPLYIVYRQAILSNTLRVMDIIWKCDHYKRIRITVRSSIFHSYVLMFWCLMFFWQTWNYCEIGQLSQSLKGYLGLLEYTWKRNIGISVFKKSISR